MIISSLRCVKSAPPALPPFPEEGMNHRVSARARVLRFFHAPIDTHTSRASVRTWHGASVFATAVWSSSLEGRVVDEGGGRGARVSF